MLSRSGQITPPQILISAYPFAQQSPAPIEILHHAGLAVRRHPFQRKPTAAELKSLLQGVQGLIAGTEVLSAGILSGNPELQVISRIGVGLDSVDLTYCAQQGITVLTTPDAATESVAEYTLGLILALCRGIVSSHQALRQGSWQRHFGLELTGARLGLLGFGRIGRAVAGKARGLGLQVQACDPRLSAAEIADAGAEPLSWQDLLASSHILSLHLPLHDDTHHLLDAQALAQMPQGSYLINTARGPIVDEAALFRALVAGHLAGAALDVFGQEPYTGPLLQLDNVILTAHQAANSRQARLAMETAAARNLAAFWRNTV